MQPLICHHGEYDGDVQDVLAAAKNIDVFSAGSLLAHCQR